MPSVHRTHLTSRRMVGERGAAAVEFALVLIPLILLIFGMVEFSIAYNRSQGIHAAAREGARVGALPQSTVSEIEGRVEDALEGVIPDDQMGAVGIAVPTGTCKNRTGDSVIVKVTFDHTIDIPFWPPSPHTVSLTGNGEFRCE